MLKKNNLSYIKISFVFFFFVQGICFSAESLQVQQLEDHFNIYRLKPSLRTEKDVFKLHRLPSGGYKLHMGYRRSLKNRESQKEICNAYRWLFFGRGKYGQSSAKAFKDHPKLKKIELEFFDVEDGTTLGKRRGQVLPSRQYVSYLKLVIGQTKTLRNKAQIVKIKKKLYKGNCSKIGSQYVESAKFNENYIKKNR